MRVLITGAAGFIGSHLADRFHAAEHEVFGIDNLLTGRRDNVGGWGFSESDVAAPDFSAWAAELDPDWIIHCAASYSDRDKWHRDTQTNVAGSVNVAIAARSCGARVVYFQTALIYGNKPCKPRLTYERVSMSSREMRLVDTSVVPLSVDTAAAPENSYAISKYAGGQYLRHAGVPLLEFRLANIYGPRNLSGPVPTFYKRITEGQPCTVSAARRDFVYVQDLVELVDQAVAEDAAGTYHVSTGRDYPIGQMYDAVVGAMDAYGVPEPDYVDIGQDEAPTILLDPSETQRDFTWRATTDLIDGVEQAVAWYRDNPVTETFTHLAEVKS